MAKYNPGFLKPLKWFKMFSELEVKSPSSLHAPTRLSVSCASDLCGFATAGCDPLKTGRGWGDAKEGGAGPGEGAGGIS